MKGVKNRSDCEIYSPHTMCQKNIGSFSIRSTYEEEGSISPLLALTEEELLGIWELWDASYLLVGIFLKGYTLKRVGSKLQIGLQDCATLLEKEGGQE